MDARVMICVPTAEMARRADFYDYLNALEKPEGTMLTFSHGQSPARNRNIMIKVALEHNATHILFVDDDVCVKPNFLRKMLEHDKDIVGGLYLMRNYPHLPIIFDESYDDGRCRFSFLYPGRKGLVQIVNTGLGACLIKTDVFRKMEEPWITLGEAERDHWCDDISFFNRARKAGFEIWVDLDAPCGHAISCVIWPNRDEQGNWFTLYNTGASESFQVPQQTPTKEALEASVREAGVELKAFPPELK